MNFNINFKNDLNINKDSNQSISTSFSQVEDTSQYVTDDSIQDIIPWKMGYFAETQIINEPRGQKYICTKCGDLFNTRLSFLTHSYIHRKYFCIVCGTYMDESSQINIHKVMFHSQLIDCDSLPVEYQTIFLNDVANKRRKNNNLKTNQIDSKVNEGCPEVKTYPAKSGVKKLKNTIISPKTLKSRFGRAITIKVKDF